MQCRSRSYSLIIMGIRYITSMVVNIDPLADDINKQSTADNSFTHDVYRRL